MSSRRLHHLPRRMLIILFSVQLYVGTGDTAVHFAPERDIARVFARQFFNPEPNDAIRSHNRRQAESMPVKYNVVYLLDSSTSIKKYDFKNALQAITLLTTKARNNTRFAMLLYARYPRVVTNFTTQERMLNRLATVNRIYGATNTYAALKLCRTDYFSEMDALNRVLLITDGLSNINKGRMLYEAFQLKMMKVEIFIVAVGRYRYGADEIAALSSIPSTHVYRVRSMKGLVRIVLWTPTPETHHWIGYRRRLETRADFV